MRALTLTSLDDSSSSMDQYLLWCGPVFYKPRSDPERAFVLVRGHWKCESRPARVSPCAYFCRAFRSAQSQWCEEYLGLQHHRLMEVYQNNFSIPRAHYWGCPSKSRRVLRYMPHLDPLGENSLACGPSRRWWVPLFFTG